MRVSYGVGHMVLVDDATQFVDMLISFLFVADESVSAYVTAHERPFLFVVRTARNPEPLSVGVSSLNRESMGLDACQSSCDESVPSVRT